MAQRERVTFRRLSLALQPDSQVIGRNRESMDAFVDLQPRMVFRLWVSVFFFMCEVVVALRV